MEWDGWNLRVGERKAKIRHSHGCWFVCVYDRRGNPSSAEYVPYGPGQLDAAKRWAEERLLPRGGKA